MCVNGQFRDRSFTAPTPSRPTHIGGIPSEGNTPAAADQSSQRQPLMKQISTPERPRPSNAPPPSHGQMPASFPPPAPLNFHESPGGSNVRHQSSFSPAAAGRQISEYGNFQTEITYGTENILQHQSERFANYESEAMKKKQAPTGEW